MVYGFFTETLKRETKIAIQNRQLSMEQLTQIHKSIKEQYQKKKRVFVMVSVIIVVMLVTMLVPTFIMISKTGPLDAKVVTMIIGGVLIVVLVVLVLVYLFAVANVRNQFIHCIKSGYPELSEKFSKASFR